MCSKMGLELCLRYRWWPWGAVEVEWALNGLLHLVQRPAEGASTWRRGLLGRASVLAADADYVAATVRPPLPS